MSVKRQCGWLGNCRRSSRRRRTSSPTVGRGPVPRQRSSAKNVRGGQAPRATVSGDARATVGRGPVPRHAPVYSKTFAGARPPRYGIRRCPCHRRARACPSPCPGLSKNVRGGQAPALRYGRFSPRVGRGRRRALPVSMSPLRRCSRLA